jgi:hypothetical protein
VRPGWTKIRRGVSNVTCGAIWQHVSGWQVHHCGHPTALWPYYGVPPGGGPMLLAPSGRGFSKLAHAQAACEKLDWEERFMPCYQVNTVSLDFQAGNLELLQKAAARLGLVLRTADGTLVATLAGNQASCQASDVPLINKLRVEYSREIVGHAALKLGWQKVVKSDNKLVLRKGM